MILASGGKLIPVEDTIQSATATPILVNVYNGLMEPVKQGLSWWIWVLIGVTFLVLLGFVLSRILKK